MSEPCWLGGSATTARRRFVPSWGVSADGDGGFSSPYVKGLAVSISMRGPWSLDFFGVAAWQSRPEGEAAIELVRLSKPWLGPGGRRPVVVLRLPAVARVWTSTCRVDHQLCLLVRCR